MENKKIHLVVTYIHDNTARSVYYSVYNSADCPMKVSYYDTRNDIGVPLYFDTEQEAQDYIKKANNDHTEREFTLIQEFTYEHGESADEAKILFTIKSDTHPTLEEGKTERSPGKWAKVRSIFICDKAAAEDYVRRFNEDAAAAFEVSRRSV